MEALGTNEEILQLDGREQAETVTSSPQQSTGVMGALSAMVRKLREWGTPDGVDLDTADAIMAEHEAMTGAYYRNGGIATLGTQGVMSGRLMRLIEQRLPENVASQPHVRQYFLERGGYMPYLA